MHHQMPMTGPLKRFRRLAQGTLNQTTARFSCVDSELTAYLADCKNYTRTLDWTFGCMKHPNSRSWLHLQALLSVPTSVANMEQVCSVCKDLSAGKNESPDKESGESGVPEFISTCVCAKCIVLHVL